jgi:hypothetical protein
MEFRSKLSVNASIVRGKLQAYTESLDLYACTGYLAGTI